MLYYICHAKEKNFNQEQNMKPQTIKRGAPESPHLPPPPNERAGISPVTVRRLMADLEYNYYQVRKTQGPHLEGRGWRMVK